MPKLEEDLLEFQLGSARTLDLSTLLLNPDWGCCTSCRTITWTRFQALVITATQ